MSVTNDNELSSFGPLPWWWKTPIRRWFMWHLRRRISRCTQYPTE
jgi:hypothetical protein